jgi:hypothetical protein
VLGVKEVCHYALDCVFVLVSVDGALENQHPRLVTGQVQCEGEGEHRLAPSSFKIEVKHFLALARCSKRIFFSFVFRASMESGRCFEDKLVYLTVLKVA